MLRILFIGLPVLVLALGIPLAAQWVPPNRFYGYRTATTFASVEAWYRVNRATGLALIGAGLISGFMVLLLDQRVIALKPEPRYIIGILLSGIVLPLPLGGLHEQLGWMLAPRAAHTLGSILSRGF